MVLRKLILKEAAVKSIRSPLSIANERFFLVVRNDFLITMKHLEGGGSIYRSKFAPAKTGAVEVESRR